MFDGVTVMPSMVEPPVTSQTARSVRKRRPAWIATMDLIVFSWPETRDPEIASEAWIGFETLKLYGAPGCERKKLCGAPASPARTRRCWKYPGTSGLRSAATPRTAVAAAVPAEKWTVGTPV